MADVYMLKVVPKRWSHRDVLRKERWAENAAALRKMTDDYVAMLTPEPTNGWQAVIENAWAKWERDSFERFRLYFGR